MGDRPVRLTRRRFLTATVAAAAVATLPAAAAAKKHPDTYQSTYTATY